MPVVMVCLMRCPWWKCINDLLKTKKGQMKSASAGV